MNLIDIYNEHLHALQEAINNYTYTGSQRLTNPLFVDVTNEFEKADIKVFIYGQETNDWSTAGDSVDDFLSLYKDFYWTGRC